MKNPPLAAGSRELRPTSPQFSFHSATNHPQDQSWGGGRDPRGSGLTAVTVQEPQRRPDFFVLFFADFLVLLLDFVFLAAIMYHPLSIERKDAGKHVSKLADVPVHVANSCLPSQLIVSSRLPPLAFPAMLFRRMPALFRKRIHTCIRSRQDLSATPDQPQQ